MKRVVILIGSMVLFFVANVQAKSVNVAAKLPSNLKNEITREIAYPQFAEDAQLEGEVWMKVYVTEESTVKIVDLSATQPDLGDYVREEISGMKIKKNDAKVGQVYFLKVDFNLLSK